MSSNTLRVIESLTTDLEFDPDYFFEDAFKTMNDTASERGLRVDREDVRYLGEVDAPEKIGPVEGVAFYAFEAEAH